MTVSELKKSDEFKAFVTYLKRIWLGNGFEFNLRYTKQPDKCDNFNSLNEIKNNYSYGKKDLSINNQILISCKSLIDIGIELKDTIKILNGIEKILKWGDPRNFTANFTFFKEKDNNGTLLEYIDFIKNNWSAILNKDFDFNQESDFNIRSAAGMSKVHSLILKDFIIYDSRVAKAIAFLILKWSENPLPANWFQIYLLPTGSTVDDNHILYGFEKIGSGKYYYKKHFYSNIIASLIVKSAVNEINRGSDQKITTRDFEAALFMIGYDVRNLPCEAKN